MWNIYKFHPKKWTQNDQKFDEHKPKRERRRRIRKRNNKACREVVETSETTIFASLTGQTTRKRLSMLRAIS